MQCDSHVRLHVHYMYYNRCEEVTNAVSSIIVIFVLTPKKKDNIYVRGLQIFNKYSVSSTDHFVRH